MEIWVCEIYKIISMDLKALFFMLNIIFALYSFWNPGHFFMRQFVYISISMHTDTHTERINVEMRVSAPCNPSVPHVRAARGAQPSGNDCDLTGLRVLMN